MKQYLLFLRDDILRNWGKLPFGIVAVFIWIWCSSLFTFNHAVVFYLRRKHKYIINFLMKRYGHLVPKFFDENPYKKDCDLKDLPIWVFWYQGEDNMPVITKLCYRNICKYSNGRKVFLLTKDNLGDYLEIPAWLFEKVEKGMMGFANFSDIIRLQLLYIYGGTWIDATVFVNAPIDNSRDNKIFDSVKIYPLTKEHISGYRWATFYLFSYPQSEAIKFFLDVMMAYWKDGFNKIIDYFLIDYTFVMLYENNAEFKKIIDGRPYTNLHIHDLSLLLNKPYNGLFEKWSDTHVFKLNKKFKPLDSTPPHHVITVYEKMLYDM